MKTINQKTRLILFVTSCIVLICICLTYFAIYSMKKNAENIFNQQGFSIIEKSKSYIDGDKFESFSKNSYDLNDFYYETYNNLFTLKNNSDCSYIYTLIPYQNTNFKYVIDASDVLTSEDLETPGTIVDVSEDYEIIQNCIKEKKDIATKMYYTEEWGWIITFYGPILNSKDSVVGIVACDFLVFDFLSEIKKVQTIMICLGVFFLLVFSIFSFLYLSSFFKKLKTVTDAMKEIADGETDLTARLESKTEDELGELSIACNSVIEKLQRMISLVKSSLVTLSDKSENLFANSETTVSQIDTIREEVDRIDNQADKQNILTMQASGNISNLREKINSLTSNLNNQTSAIRESSSSIQEITSNIESISRSVNMMAEDYEKIVTETKEGIRLQNLVREKVNEVEEEANNLQEANVTITNIAAQTNLLAMNASIEAAHAGKAGAGFSVVAGEIKALAETSNKQTEAIKELLQKVNQSIQGIADASKVSEQTFNSLGERIILMENVLQEIQDGINEQSIGSRHVMEMVDVINNSAQSIMRDSEEMNENGESVFKNMLSLGKSSDDILKNTHLMVSSLDEIKTCAKNASESATQNLSLTENLNNLVAGYKTE